MNLQRDLAQRLSEAAKLGGDQRWELVSLTIELMIDAALCREKSIARGVWPPAPAAQEANDFAKAHESAKIKPGINAGNWIDQTLFKILSVGLK